MAFAYKGTFTVDHTKVPSTQTDFPVLISVTDATLKTVGNGGQMQSSSGYDFRPFSDSGLSSALTYQLHFYDGTNGKIILRVKIASLSSASDTIIYCGFGDAGIVTDGSSTSVWDSNYVAYFPLGDSSGLNVNDFKGTNNGTTSGSPAAGTGKVDGGILLNPAFSQYVDCGTAAMPTSPITVSAWISQTTFGSPEVVVSKGYDGTNTQWNLTSADSSGHMSFQCYDGSVRGATCTTALTLSTLAQIVGTYDGTTWKIYFNGTLDASSVDSGPTATTRKLEIGSVDVVGTADQFWEGVIDEVSIASTARSANWITAMYNNESSPGAGGFYSSIVFAANSGTTDAGEWMTKTIHERYRQTTNVAY